MNKSTRTRTSRAPRRSCTGCHRTLTAAEFGDAGLCESCTDQSLLFDLPTDDRPRRHDGRWL